MAFMSSFRRVLGGSATALPSQFAAIRHNSTLTSPKLFISGTFLHSQFFLSNSSPCVCPVRKLIDCTEMLCFCVLICGFPLFGLTITKILTLTELVDFVYLGYSFQWISFFSDLGNNRCMVSSQMMRA